jgi:NitT/TauT family transport system permease protein
VKRAAVTGITIGVLAAWAAAMLAQAAQGAGPVLWAALAAWVLVLWRLLDHCARHFDGRIGRWLAPALLGLAGLYLWEIAVIALQVPSVLLPAPHAVGEALVKRWDVLAADFRQTAFSVAAGYVIGCGGGLAVAVLADRFDVLKRGLLPLAGLAGAVPIVGIAPIMVMWFGFDWQSKAAVAAIVTFFPMLVNALAGLAAVDPMHRDLMHSYAAGPTATLLKLRGPSALPFVFNALKINSTLALISAIVAEFFGSPIVGLGFRISAEVARMNVDVVWAAIALAALAGSLFYGVVALAERAATSWHPSFRR